MLTITGTSFPHKPEEVKVSMGERSCEILTASGTELTCVVPANPPGDVNVVVDTKTKGKKFRRDRVSGRGLHNQESLQLEVLVKKNDTALFNIVRMTIKFSKIPCSNRQTLE